MSGKREQEEEEEEKQHSHDPLRTAEPSCHESSTVYAPEKNKKEEGKYAFHCFRVTGSGDCGGLLRKQH